MLWEVGLCIDDMPKIDDVRWQLEGRCVDDLEGHEGEFRGDTRRVWLSCFPFG